jgi:hypothetical protein
MKICWGFYWIRRSLPCSKSPQSLSLARQVQSTFPLSITVYTVSISTLSWNNQPLHVNPTNLLSPRQHAEFLWCGVVSPPSNVQTEWPSLVGYLWLFIQNIRSYWAYLVRTVFSEYIMQNRTKLICNSVLYHKEYFKTYNSKVSWMSRTEKLVFFSICFVYWCAYFQYD